MKKYGEIVKYVRNGVELNALVIQSNPGPDGEHLILSYLDPVAEAVVIRDLTKVQARTFSVAPYADGASQGWKEIPETAALEAEVVELKAEVETHTETINQLVLAVQKPKLCADCADPEACKGGCVKNQEPKTEETGK